jgi:hypothetical protein
VRQPQPLPHAAGEQDHQKLHVPSVLYSTSVMALTAPSVSVPPVPPRLTMRLSGENADSHTLPVVDVVGVTVLLLLRDAVLLAVREAVAVLLAVHEAVAVLLAVREAVGVSLRV